MFPRKIDFRTLPFMMEPVPAPERGRFGVVCGGFLARWLPRKQTITYAELNRAYEAAAAPGESLAGGVVTDAHFRSSSLLDWVRDYDGEQSVVRIDANGTAWWVTDAGKPASGQLLVQLADGRTALGYGEVI